MYRLLHCDPYRFFVENVEDFYKVRLCKRTDEYYHDPDHWLVRRALITVLWKIGGLKCEDIERYSRCALSAVHKHMLKGLNDLEDKSEDFTHLYNDVLRIFNETLIKWYNIFWRENKQ